MAQCQKCSAEIGSGGVAQEGGALFCPECAAGEVKATPYATYTLLGANFLMFVVMMAQGADLTHPTVSQLLGAGASHGPDSYSQPWRILCSNFLHVGLLHLFCNMYALFSIGTLAETLFGARRFVMVYLLAGIGGEMTSLWWNPTVTSVGSSGAIFGNIGGLLAYFRMYREDYEPEDLRPQLKSIYICIGINLVLGFTVPGINNAASIGGFVVGLLATSALLTPPLGTMRDIAAVTAALAAFTLSFYMLDWRIESSPELQRLLKARAYLDYDKRVRKLIQAQDENLTALSLHFLKDKDPENAAQRLEAASKNRDALKEMTASDGDMAEYHKLLVARGEAAVAFAESLAKPEIPQSERETLISRCQNATSDVNSWIEKFVTKYKLK